MIKGNQPIRLPGLKPGVCLRPELRPRGSGLILSGAFYPDLKSGVWRRRTYQFSIDDSADIYFCKRRGDEDYERQGEPTCSGHKRL